MARMNKKTVTPAVFTHNMGPADNIEAERQLMRSVMTCMLWEKTFYEDGEEIAARITRLAKQVKPAFVSDLAIEARSKMQLRHVPLLLARVLAERRSVDPTMKAPEFGTMVSDTILKVIQRPDEITEFLALYWKSNKGKTLSNAVKRGLGAAFGKFSEYQLAKWNKDADIKLRDVMFLTHPKPEGGNHFRNKDWRKQKADNRFKDPILSKKEVLFHKLAEDTLETPDTWEVALSAGANKKETWERLIREDKLGGMAVLMNLRNMTQAGVSEKLIAERLKKGCERALPYRFVTAARYAPQFERELEEAMYKAVEDIEKLSGTTGLLIDVSGSMDWALVNNQVGNWGRQPVNGETSRIDVACGLGILLAEKAERFKVATFSDRVVEVPNRRGFALRDAVVGSQRHNGTWLGRAVEDLKKLWSGSVDRLIVLTDEQSSDPVGKPWIDKSYMVNLAPYQNGVGYKNKWNHIDGWSERIFDYIQIYEAEFGGTF